MNINVLFISFVLYSCIGWIHESVFCSLYFEKRFINRGFLIGPYCPIYGVGAIACYLILGEINNMMLTFLLAAFICCFLEYITGYLMEKLFNKRWWDYSEMPFQIHGRICLYGALLFGVGSVVICQIVEPWVILFTAELNQDFIKIFTYSIALFMGMDLILTLMYWSNLSKKINKKYETIFELYIRK